MDPILTVELWRHFSIQYLGLGMRCRRKKECKDDEQWTKHSLVKNCHFMKVLFKRIHKNRDDWFKDGRP